MKKVNKIVSLGAFALALFLAMPAISNAEMVAAYFTDGNGTAAVDAFVGMPGDGWYGPWLTKGNATVPTGTVLSTNPLPTGVGNYLDVNSPVSGSGKGGTIGRNYSDGIDTSLDHDISLLLRVDENLSTFTTTQDRYMIYDNVGSANLSSGTGASTTWSIAVYGLNTIVENSRYWLLAAYDAQGVASQINTGIQIAAGNTYRFEIFNHPQTQTWDAKVTNITTSTSSSLYTGMYWRDRTGYAASGILQFYAAGSATNELREYSLDSIEITQVPEPSALALIVIGALAACGMGRRHA